MLMQLFKYFKDMIFFMSQLEMNNKIKSLVKKKKIVFPDKNVILFK